MTTEELKKEVAELDQKIADSEGKIAALNRDIHWYKKRKKLALSQMETAETSAETLKDISNNLK